MRSLPFGLSEISRRIGGLGNMNVLDKFRKLQGSLKKWNKEVFGNINFNIQHFEVEIAEVNARLEEGNTDEVLI